MTLQQSFKAAIISFFVVVSTACAPGFETSSGVANSPNGNGSLDGGGGGTDGTGPSWDDVNLDGSINGGRFGGTQVVSIDKVAKTLVVRLPFIAGVSIGVQVPISIADIPGATFGVELNTDGSSSLVLRIPLAKVLNGVDTLPSSRLPNGDALPAIPEGELPSVALSVNGATRLKGALYLGPTVVGIFIATKFDPYIRLTMPIRNSARTQTLGYFTTIPAKPAFDGGFFISIALPDDLARAIDDLL